MKTRASISLALVIFIIMQFMICPLAFADETSTTSQTPTVNSDGTLTVVSQYPATEEEPTLPEAITQGGQRYTLNDTTAAPAEDYEPPKQTFTRTAFSEVPIEGINNLGAYFPATYPINEGEYQGEIGLDPTNPYTVVNRYEAFSVQVDREQVFSGLPDNDVSRIPTSQSFEVSSSASPGATEWRSLQILDVSYAIAGTDHLGLPNNYTAFVTYRGQEEYLELVYYDVTAHYSGDITSSAEQMAATGIYSPAERTGVIAEDTVPLAGPEIPLFPLAIAGTVVVVLLAIPLLYVFFLKNARLIRVITETDDDREGRTARGTKARTELVCRRRLVLKDDTAEFRIPPDVDIFGGDSYYLVIKPRFANKEGDVMLTWQGKIMAVLPLAEHTDINFKEMLITSVEAILMETDLLD